jgi:hypothetical protein
LIAMTAIQPMPTYIATDSFGYRKPTVFFAMTPSTASVHATPNNVQPQTGSIATSANGV